MNAAELMREQQGPYGKDIQEPYCWPNDGGARVEVIVDPNWLIDGKPRVIRRVSWRRCMCCTRWFFSQDIARVRLDDACKESETDKSSYG